jgi:hypothetical protein
MAFITSYQLPCTSRGAGERGCQFGMKWLINRLFRETFIGEILGLSKWNRSSPLAQFGVLVVYYIYKFLSRPHTGIHWLFVLPHRSTDFSLLKTCVERLTSRSFSRSIVVQMPDESVPLRERRQSAPPKSSLWRRVIIGMFWG